MQRISRCFVVTAPLVAILAALTVGAKGPAPSEPSTALAEYVKRPDDSYAWRVRRRGTLETGDYAELILTSQTWRGIVWKHQLFVYRPTSLQHAAQALLFVDGGNWNDSLEDTANEKESLPEKVRLIAALADMIHSPVAIVRQVPMQPLFNGRKEDQIIALTFAKYFESGEPDWPLLLPMVKTAVRAMDATQEFAKQVWHIGIDHFLVTGASKRGWTSWLTAAIDPRVNALAPIVINMLNMSAHDQLQRESFGGYSDQIRDYTDLHLHEQLASEKGTALQSIVDPYAYRKQLTQPKLIVLATNDAYWPVDSLNNYWNDLEGDKHILYVPNNGHGIDDYPRVIAALTALERSLVGGKPLPKLSWCLKEQADQARLELNTDVAPLLVRRWIATADTRDFRKAEWTATPLAARGNPGHSFVAELKYPSHGYNAMFLEAEFPGDPLPYNLSTTLHVFAGGKSK